MHLLARLRSLLGRPEQPLAQQRLRRGLKLQGTLCRT